MGCKMSRKWFVTQIVYDEVSTLTNKLIENSRNPAGPSSARKIVHMKILYRCLQKLHLPIKSIIISLNTNWIQSQQMFLCNIF